MFVQNFLYDRKNKSWVDAATGNHGACLARHNFDGATPLLKPVERRFQHPALQAQDKWNRKIIRNGIKGKPYLFWCDLQREVSLSKNF